MKKILLFGIGLLLVGLVAGVSSADGAGKETNVFLGVAKGNVIGHAGENKFGRAPAGVQQTATDIWDRADATPTQQIWVAPTTARPHNIESTSAEDDGSPVGFGARTLRLYGLKSWDKPEVSEDITLNGVTSVVTVSSYVTINRMYILTKGSNSVNTGTITAWASVDGSTTAQINAGEGQTQMAIYGIPSTQVAYITQYYASLNKASGAVATINVSLLVNPGPDSELLNFLVKHTIGVQSTGSSHFSHPFKPYFPVRGPAIIKINGIASADDVEGSAGFGLILVNN